jgi:hypothetical protein
MVWHLCIRSGSILELLFLHTECQVAIFLLITILDLYCLIFQFVIVGTVVLANRLNLWAVLMWYRSWNVNHLMLHFVVLNLRIEWLLNLDVVFLRDRILYSSRDQICLSNHNCRLRIGLLMSGFANRVVVKLVLSVAHLLLVTLWYYRVLWDN